ERRYHIADHVFRRVMQEDRKAVPIVEPRYARTRQRLDQQAMLRHRVDVRAAGLAIPARYPRQAMGDVLDFDVDRGGVAQDEPSAGEDAWPGASAGMRTRQPLWRRPARPRNPRRGHG